MLKEFWESSDSKVVDLHRHIAQVLEEVELGDPLVVSSRFGKGKAVVVLTTAGRKWSEWPGGCPAESTYPILILEMQKFLEQPKVPIPT